MPDRREVLKGGGAAMLGFAFAARIAPIVTVAAQSWTPALIRLMSGQNIARLLP